MNYCKNIIKNHFNNNLLMSEEDEERFQLGNICWNFDKLFDVRHNKAKDCCHITRKYRGSAHWSCNIHLALTKNVPVIFHNVRGYVSHLFMKKICKFDEKVTLIPNGLEKYRAFTINENLVFIDNM